MQQINNYKYSKKSIKDYQLRTRLNPLERQRVELLIAYYSEKYNLSLSKARLFNYLVAKEFENIQLDMIDIVGAVND